VINSRVCSVFDTIYSPFLILAAAQLALPARMRKQARMASKLDPRYIVIIAYRSLSTCFKGFIWIWKRWSCWEDETPFKAFPVTCGITFTYAGLRVDEDAAVLNRNGEKIPGLYACGEMIGDVFSAGYPGGSGLTSGAVFGRIAGRAAA
jgi:hypothetical protein